MQEAVTVQVGEFFPDSEIAGARTTKTLFNGLYPRSRLGSHDRCWSTRLLPEFVKSGLDSLYDIQKCFISIRPLCNRLTISGSRQQFPKREAVPVTGSQNDGDNSCRAALVPLHSSAHL